MSRKRKAEVAEAAAEPPGPTFVRYYKDIIPWDKLGAIVDMLCFPHPGARQAEISVDLVRRYYTLEQMRTQPELVGRAERFDLGAVMADPLHPSLAMHLLRESGLTLGSNVHRHPLYCGSCLRFDVDLKERDCCGDSKSVCMVCWKPYILDTARLMRGLLLSKLPPGSKVIVVFTGGRGLHFWVVSEAFMCFTGAERTELLDALLVAMKSAGFPSHITLDEGVTIQPAHLTRLVLSLHQGTGRAALPILFDTKGMPRLPKLTGEDGSPVLDKDGNPDHWTWESYLCAWDDANLGLLTPSALARCRKWIRCFADLVLKD